MQRVGLVVASACRLEGWNASDVISIERLTKRREFLAAATGARASSRGFSLQAKARGVSLAQGELAHGEEPARFGFTVTRKTGNAVERNRIRRRLREIVRLAADRDARPGFDYVLIGRRDALSLDFRQLMRDFSKSLQRAHASTEARGHGERAATQGAPAPQSNATGHGSDQL